MSAGNRAYVAASGSRSKGADPNGGHVRLYWALLDSHAWHALSPTETHLYVSMRRQLGKNNNGDISATLSTMRHFGFKSPTTLAKSLRALMAIGLIAKTRDTGGLARGGTVCCLYRFTSEPCSAKPAKDVQAMKATNDYLNWKSLAHATAAIKEAHRAAKRPDHHNSNAIKAAKGKLQKVERASTSSGALQFIR